jgi:hypothetical protein
MEDKSRSSKFFGIPMFFDSSLLDALQKPPYTVKMSTKYFGSIIKGEQWSISFGISPRGYVHFWLGDLRDNLEIEDYDVFLKHYFQPDRLGKHFYKVEVLGRPLEGNEEN